MIEAWFDGACWPNPGGHSSCGALIKRDGVTIWEHAEYLGDGQVSNNSAEYAGLVAVMRQLVVLGIQDATIYGDSDLVIQQMSGRWKVKTKRRPIYLSNYNLAANLKIQLPRLQYKWIPREENTEADFLSTQPLRDLGLRPDYSVSRSQSNVFRSNNELDTLFEAALVRSD